MHLRVMVNRVCILVRGSWCLKASKGRNVAEANCEACQADCAELNEGGRLKLFGMLSAAERRVFGQLRPLLRRRRSEG
jgi:hypothetical protein